MVEHFGGELGVLGYPMHGKPSPVYLTDDGKKAGNIFDGLPDTFEVARYHSLHGIKDKIPDCLEITALTEDDIVMGIRHKTLPFAAVQFHPESILTSPAHGMAILKNALRYLKADSADTNGASVEYILDNVESLSVADLKGRLQAAGLGSSGSKTDLAVKLTLLNHKIQEAKDGSLNLDAMSVPELRELKSGLGLKGTATNKSQLVAALKECLEVKS